MTNLTLSSSCCSVMVCVLTDSCSCARPHTRQPSLGAAGASPEIRAAMRPLRLVPTQLACVLIKLLRQAEGQPAGVNDSHKKGRRGGGGGQYSVRCWVTAVFLCPNLLKLSACLLSLLCKPWVG
jgi:hypothetical protein